jgi:D-sedoheptulose 7-phosphate isomerase
MNEHPRTEPALRDICGQYAARVEKVLRGADWSAVETLGEELRSCWATGRQVFMCGNGGSAANAIHLANDYLYVIGRRVAPGLRIQSLTANQAVMTCLANDEGYDQVYSLQLKCQARKGDVLIVLSGSGNSPNVLRALETAREMGLRSFAILGYSGGKAKALADVPIHFAVDDMQISEDLQMMVGHMIMQWLMARGPAAA